MGTKNFETFISGGFMIVSGITFEEIMKIIYIVLGVAVALFGLIREIVYWYKKAKEDDKITIDEVKEVVDKVDEGLKNIEDKIKK